MELILINGNIVTMDTLNPRADAVAINNGKFVKIGSNKEILSLKEKDTNVIDLKGKMLLPGFIDSHMHFAMLGSNMQECNLIGTNSVEELIERVKGFVKSKKIRSDQWIIGKGWNQDYFDIKKLPTRYDLDKISMEQPICLTRACYHLCVVNSKALEVSGISINTPQVENGQFDLDEKGEPLGIFKENALKLIYDNLPSPQIEDFKKMIIDASNYAISQGVTSVQTDDFMLPGIRFTDVLKAYSELRKNKKLIPRIYEQCLLPSMDLLNSFLDMGYRTGQGDNFFKIGPLKLIGDGNLGNRTAYLCSPYSDVGSISGMPRYTQESLDELVITAHNAGMNVAIHCIGDKTMYMAFESFEKAQRQNPTVDSRHGIIHCQLTDQSLLDKFRDLSIIAYIQPIFLNYDLHIVEARIGKERSKTTYNWKSLFDRGVHVACGSDCPVEALDVLPGIYSAVTRKDLQGYPESGWLPDQKLTVEQALFGFTLGAAYASCEENIKGSIQVGKLADMVVLSDNIFEIHPDKIKDVEVEMTFIDGKLVFSK